MSSFCQWIALCCNTWQPCMQCLLLLVHAASHWPQRWWHKSFGYSQKGSFADSGSPLRSPTVHHPCWCGFCSVSKCLRLISMFFNSHDLRITTSTKFKFCANSFLPFQWSSVEHPLGSILLYPCSISLLLLCWLWINMPNKTDNFQWCSPPPPLFKKKQKQKTKTII